jgi:hypothetical protein
MQLPLTTHIAGQKTVLNWLTIRPSLNDFNNLVLWNTIFTEYFQTRLKDRYLDPINSIKSDGFYSGEGFSIMTIICSLIEFLETTYQGLNYRFVNKDDPPLGDFEYSRSKKLFIEFLTLRKPFLDHFDYERAESFYKNVRCGLLHEARTNGKWTIWGSSSGTSLTETTATEIIVYRDNFYNTLLEYVNTHYKAELLADEERKRAFLRKFDRLCIE